MKDWDNKCYIQITKYHFIYLTKTSLKCFKVSVIYSVLATASLKKTLFTSILHNVISFGKCSVWGGWARAENKSDRIWVV
jgi:hypothetical protein